MRADFPPRVTSFLHGQKLHHESPPPGSLVSHEMTTQRSPKEMGLGAALIFPVISPLRSLLSTRKPGSAFRCYSNLRRCNCCWFTQACKMIVAKQKFQFFACRVGGIESACFLDTVF